MGNSVSLWCPCRKSRNLEAVILSISATLYINKRKKISLVIHLCYVYFLSWHIDVVKTERLVSVLVHISGTYPIFTYVGRIWLFLYWWAFINPKCIMFTDVEPYKYMTLFYFRLRTYGNKMIHVFASKYSSPNLNNGTCFRNFDISSDHHFLQVRD